MQTQKAGGRTAFAAQNVSTLVYGEAKDPFLANVKRLVESNLRYPRKARALRLAGTATVEFSVAADGTLETLSIHTSSGQTVLDEAAVRAVRLSESQWGAPERRLTLRFPIRFRLAG